MDPLALVLITLAGGKLTCEAPETWKEVAPRVSFIEKEFAIAAPEGSEATPARLTISTAGGSVDANVARWIGQFQGTEGGADRSAAQIEKETVAGMATTFIDLGGVYMESARGPFGPKVPRRDYRLVAAIVETAGAGNYFFKLIGPREAVDPAADAFRAMIRSLKKT